MRTAPLMLASSLATLLLAACAGVQPTDTAAPPAAATSTESPVGTTWEWVELVTPVETVKVDDPSRYTLRIDGGRAALRADCNRGSGDVALGPDGAVAFKPMAMTRAMCPPGSLSDRYARDLGRAARYFFKDGELHFDLPADSGTLRFRRAATQ